MGAEDGVWESPLLSPKVVSVELDHVTFFSLKEMRELLCTWVLKVPKQKDWHKEGSDLSDTGFLYIFLEGI